MTFDFTPSPQLVEKAKKIFTLHETGLTYPQIAVIMKNHRVTVIRLASWYRDNVVNKEKNEK